MTPEKLSLKHHVRNTLKARSKLNLLLLGVFVVASVGLGLQHQTSQAATTFTLKGRVFNAATGEGMGGARVDLCYGRIVTTDANGYWSLPNRPAKDRYCVRYKDGVPGDWINNKAPNSRPDQGVRQTYEYQYAGINCFNNRECPAAEQRYDLPGDDNLDIGIAPRPKKPPATPPTVPGNFEATPGIDEASVALVWSPATAAAGLSVYVLERSINETQWSLVSNGLTELYYRDESTDSGVRYYYRLKALDDQGRTSEYTFANARTPTLVGNVDVNRDSIYTSSDGVVSVLLPAGAITESANCSLASEQLKVRGVTYLAGPYRLRCRTAGYREITKLNHPVTWTYHLKGKVANSKNITAKSYITAAKEGEITEPYFDKATETFQFKSTTPSLTALTATTQTSAIQTGLVLSIIILFVTGGGFLWIYFRRRRKQQFENLVRAREYSDQK